MCGQSYARIEGTTIKIFLGFGISAFQWSDKKTPIKVTVKGTGWARRWRYTKSKKEK